MSKPRVGIFGLTGCAGDQLAILNCEDELLDIVELLDVRDFVMASSAADTECELDIALVEGAVVTPRDEELLRRIRERSAIVIALGTCAVWGGVAAMEPQADRRELLRHVYGAIGDDYSATRARRLEDVVKVDFGITGCPIEKHQFLEALSALLRGVTPVLPVYPVCTECRIRENRCLLIQSDQPCLGALTVAGCNARCPSLGVACIGCRGPARDANFMSALVLLESKGVARSEVLQRLGAFVPIELVLKEGAAA